MNYVILKITEGRESVVIAKDNQPVMFSEYGAADGYAWFLANRDSKSQYEPIQYDLRAARAISQFLRSAS